MNNIIFGLSGLNNLGNTCYLNSAIQCISNTAILREFILHNKFHNILIEKNKDKIDDNMTIDFLISKTTIFQLYKLLIAMWHENCTIVPISFNKNIVLEKKIFTALSQHDAQEAFDFILDTIHDELSQKKQIDINFDNRVILLLNLKEETKKILKDNTIDETTKIKAKEYYSQYKFKNIDVITLIKSYKTYINMCNNHSIISNLFEGIFHSSISCPNCAYRSDNFEPFKFIHVEIPENNKTLDIYDCIKAFCSVEKLDDDNKWYCEGCKNKVNGEKKLCIWKLPPYLLIHIKRFKKFYDNKSNEYITKLNTLVTFPINNLIMNDFISNINNTSYQKYNYNLYAICNHIGDVYGGHYFSYCKNNNLWYKFNDEDISTINEPIEDILIDNKAYILCYELANNYQ